jgi:hypothetical protein
MQPWHWPSALARILETSRKKLRIHLDDVSWIKSVELSGPGFLNMSLADHAVLDRLEQRSNHPKLGVVETQAGQIVAIDYSAGCVRPVCHVPLVEMRVVVCRRHERTQTAVPSRRWLAAPGFGSS